MCTEPVFTEVACSGSTLRLSCRPRAIGRDGRDLRIRLVDVAWGRSDRVTCSRGARRQGALARKCSSSTQEVAIVEDLCRTKQTCDVCADRVGLGEPCGDNTEYLTVTYVCQGKRATSYPTLIPSCLEWFHKEGVIIGCS